jgi:hypothetical protein
MAELDPEIVEELYGTAPDEFVGRRGELAKELRSGGDRVAADAVKKLRKPSVSAAAVNRLARDASHSVSSLLTAGEALRQAQLGGGDRDAIRSAAAEEREAVDRLVAEAGAYGLSPAALDEVRSTLHAAALDDSVREDVRRGVLVEPRQAMGLGGLGSAVVSRPPRAGRAGAGGAPSPEAEPAAPAGPKRRGKPAVKGGDDGGRKNAAAEGARREAAEAERKAAAAERAAQAERRRAAKERVRAAKTALREAEKAAKAAERERDQAAKALEKAERAAEGAREDADRAREELEAAESA